MKKRISNERKYEILREDMETFLTCTISTTVTPSEYIRLKDQAAARKMNLAAYLRELIGARPRDHKRKYLRKAIRE